MADGLTQSIQQATFHYKFKTAGTFVSAVFLDSFYSVTYFNELSGTCRPIYRMMKVEWSE